MTTRAKFSVQRIERSLSSVWDGGTQTYKQKEVHTIFMLPVSGGSDENKKFWAATPSGELRLSIVDPDAIKDFGLGSEVYVDFSPAK